MLIDLFTLEAVVGLVLLAIVVGMLVRALVVERRRTRLASNHGASR